MDWVQHALLAATFVACAAAVFAYNDGRDNWRSATAMSLLLIGGAGWVAFGVSELLNAQDRQVVPSCTYVTEGGRVVAKCESFEELQQRNASGSFRVVDLVFWGPLTETIATLSGGGVGLGVAMATKRRPADGRSLRLEPPE